MMKKKILFFFLFSMCGLILSMPAFAVCTSPTGVAGEMGFNVTGTGVYQYCDGSTWRSMSASSSASLPTPLAHWKLDETSGSSIADSQGSNTGIWSDNDDNDVSEESIVGYINNGITFDGVNDIVNFGSNSSLDDLVPITVCTWMYIHTMPPSYASIVTKITSADVYSGWDLYIGSFGQVGFSTWNGGVHETYGGDVTTGAWTHFCATWNGSSGTSGIKLYLNGTLLSSPGYGWGVSTASDAANSVTIGSIVDGGGAANVTLDDVRIYNAELTAAQIAQLNVCGQPQSMFYDFSAHVLKWCGATGDLHVAGTAGTSSGSCASTTAINGGLEAGAEGALQVANSGTNAGRLYFCDGSVWKRIPS